MGVFCLDRTERDPSSALVFGTPALLWALLAQALLALGAPAADAHTLDGYLPSWLLRGWSQTLFGALGELVLVCRPRSWSAAELTPVGAYRAGTPAAAAWSRSGEHLSVYDTSVAPVLLHFAQIAAVAPGLIVTTLRPPAPGAGHSPVAARALMRRSGLLRISSKGES